MHPRLDVWAALTFALMIVCGGALYLCLLLLLATLSFWLLGADTYPLVIVVSFNEFSKYPLSLFPRGLQVALTWVVPFAFTGYFPAAFLLGTPGARLTALAIVPVTALFGLLALAFWRRGLRHYQSCGL